MSSSAYAEDLALKLTSKENAIQGTIYTISINAIASGQSRNVSGAAFTLEYDPSVLTFIQATSTFFGTFVAQGITPTSVAVDGVTYMQPMVVNNQALGNVFVGKVLIAAAATEAKPISTSKATTLFQVRFNVKKDAVVGPTHITLHQSIISNTNAGYAETGESVPVLIGATESGTYPVLTTALTPYTFLVLNKNDYDGDELSNTAEGIQGTNPWKSDTDNDDLSDGAEVNIYHTNPLLADTDGDGVLDGDEIKNLKENAVMSIINLLLL